MALNGTATTNTPDEEAQRMSSDVMYTAILTMALLFMGLWASILALGFVLSLRDDAAQERKKGAGFKLVQIDQRRM